MLWSHPCTVGGPSCTVGSPLHCWGPSGTLGSPLCCGVLCLCDLGSSLGSGTLSHVCPLSVGWPRVGLPGLIGPITALRVHWWPLSFLLHPTVPSVVPTAPVPGPRLAVLPWFTPQRRGSTGADGGGAEKRPLSPVARPRRKCSVSAVSKSCSGPVAGLPLGAAPSECGLTGPAAGLGQTRKLLESTPRRAEASPVSSTAMCTGGGHAGTGPPRAEPPGPGWCPLSWGLAGSWGGRPRAGLSFASVSVLEAGSVP